ncbi:SDR family oxidoreductase [Streptomyces sp. CA-142005]|uniref:SDR family oxidoreductase n=1 Tax=Streptomyces sp. CA-142005 TaxID=3240052 RepID=UPI003D90637C
MSLYAVELDVTSQDSADAAVDPVLAAEGRLDVVVHNAGHMVTGSSSCAHRPRPGGVERGRRLRSRPGRTATG